MLLRHDPAPLAHVLDDFEGDSTERLTGFTAPAVADPDPDDVLLYIYAFAVRRRPPKNCDPALLLSYDGKPHSPLFWVKAGNRWHVARLETDRKRLLSRAGRCVRVERDRDGSQFFVRSATQFADSLNYSFSTGYANIGAALNKVHSTPSDKH